MYFILSKTLVFLTAPSNIIITLAIVGTVLLFTRFVRLGRRLLVVGMLGIVVFGLSPLGKVLLAVLEKRFPAWSATQGAPAGFIILTVRSIRNCRWRTARWQPIRPSD
jgi:uncharacterized SAM-binding protein YcdF (DUF218 family)